jgi:hypothetical protein
MGVIDDVEAEQPRGALVVSAQSSWPKVEREQSAEAESTQCMATRTKYGGQVGRAAGGR